MNIFKKTGFLILLLFAGKMVMAQSLSYKTLSQELQILKRQLVPDQRLAILNFELKDTLRSPLVISGETNLPEAKKQILRLLTAKTITIVDSLRLLPDTSLRDKTWALAALSVSNLRSQPDHASELVSQLLMGTPMKVLDVRENWYRVQTPELYIGWIDSAGLKRLNPKEIEHWKKSDRYLYNLLSGYVYDAPALKSNIVSDLALGDLFEVEAVIHDFFKIRLPDGRTGFVPKAGCLAFGEWSQTEPKVQSILEVARQMTGFPYLWGGVSSKAMDCSGLVKLAYYSQAIILARDASQQASHGETIEFSNIRDLQPGDLLFFGRSAQRVTHVGIYLGEGNFIHSSGRVNISSIIPGDPKYNPSRKYVGACRVLNSLNTEGIIRVKDHPWYCIQP